MRKCISLLLIIVLLASFGATSFAASIGTTLTSPEAGWQRVDDTNPSIVYSGATWNREANPAHSGGYLAYPSSLAGKIQFKFRGTKLRIIDAWNTTHSTAVNITIDGVTETYTQSGPLAVQALSYEKTGLSGTIHTVEIIATNKLGVRFDAIDIDANGSMVQVGTQLTKPETGWQRFDDGDAKFLYEGSVWIQGYADHYNGSIHYLQSATTTVKFSFKGTKIRIYGYAYAERSSLTDIYVDGVKETYSEAFTPAIYSQNLFYEKIGLADKVHSVIISSPTANVTNNASFDAIDIDATGSLLAYVPPVPETKGASLNLLQGGNTIKPGIVVINYDEARSVDYSLILPYGYSNGIK